MAERTIEILSFEVAEALAPVSAALSTPAGVKSLLNTLGWELPPAVEDIGLVGLSADSVISKLEAVRNSTQEEKADDNLMLGRYTALFTAVGQLIANIIAKAAALGQGVALPANYLATTKIPEQFATRLLDYLLIVYVERRSPAVHAFLTALGVFEQKHWDPDPGLYRTGHFRRSIAFDRIGRLFTDPRSVAEELYGWGTANPDLDALITNVGFCVQALGGMVSLRRLPRNVEEALAGRSVPEAATAPMPQLLVSLIKGVGWDPLDVGVSVYGVRPTAVGASDGGIGASPFVIGSTDVSFPLSDDGKWKLGIETQFDIEGGIAVLVQPDKPLAVKTGMFGDAGGQASASGRLSVAIAYESGGSAKTNVLTIYGATHLEIGDFQTTVHFSLDGNEPDFGFLIDLSGARFVISAGDGDGFLQNVLPSEGIPVDFDLAIGWSNKNGVYFKGGAGLEATLPLHLNLFGVLQIESIYLRIQTRTLPNTTGIELIVATSAGLMLGPLAASVDRMGVSALLAFPSPGGGFGPENLTIGFKLPEGIGLVLDTAAIRGGGGLQIQPDMYSGQLQLCINNVINLTAIGLINTKLPGGAAGFALLVLITAKFQPIQLGYGFTLNGVGGLAALNHSMNQQALSDGVRNHTLDSILFPTNPVANANKIISDLQRVFPVTPGRFVFAPMVEIGWGGSVLLIDVALVLDLPSPLRLTILGRMHLLLPPATAGATDDAAKVVVINLDVQGSLDLDQDAISVDAYLYDSRLALFPITGGMAMRIRWGAQPVFLFALGGFNPRFTPPPGFPPLDRVGIQMRYDKSGVRAGLCLTSYFAVTTNTLQFGARIDAYAEVSIAKLAGYLGFDALVDMVPFHVILDLYGGVSVEAFGFKFSCDLLLTLAAFDPVTGDGHVTIDFLGKHEAPIHFSIGDAKPLPALPVADALEELMNALKDVGNWSAGVPAGTRMVVNLRPPTAAEVTASAGKPLAHPLARLSVRQRVLPFKVALQRFGAATPAQPGPFDIATLTLGSSTAAPAASAALRDDFARGQYLVLSDDDKLCAPQFESFVCGYDGLGTEKARIATPQVAEFSYDTRVIDDRAQPAKSLPDVVVSYDYTRRMGQVGGPPVAAAARYAAPPKGIKVGKPKWKSVGTDNIDANSPDTFDTYTQAQAHRRGQPGAGKQQVVESFELA